MTLKQYIEGLQALIKEDSNRLNWRVIYSHDDEGNAFQNVYSNGTIGFYDTHSKDYGTFYSIDELDYIKKIGEDVNKMSKAICIN